RRTRRDRPVLAMPSTCPEKGMAMMRQSILHQRGGAPLALLLLVAGAGISVAQDGAPVWPDPVISPSEVMARADSSMLLDALSLGDDRVIVVGERGHVLASDGDGRWQQ